VSDGYPKPISNWEGIPNDVDDALQYSNGYTYFFKEGKYWRFNDKKFQVKLSFFSGCPGHLLIICSESKFWHFGIWQVLAFTAKLW
jgi:hypothetical protein